MPTVTAETDGALLTEFSMHNSGESPSAAVESTLSQILEANAPEKYHLSAKACEGILRRAERRGKQLPEMLKLALEQQIAREKVYNQTLTGDKAKTLNSAACDTDHIPVAVYSVENHPADSRVNIDDSGKVQTLTSRMGTGGGNVPMVMEPFTSDAHHAVAYWDGGQTMATLTANNAGGNQRMPDKENFNCVIETHVVSKEGDPVVIDRAFFNQGQNAKFDPAIYTDGTVPTLVARGPAAVATTELAAYVDTTHADDVVRMDSVTAPLQARDYKGGKLVQVQYIVRRLTPTECARLQGFPDTWGHPIEKTELTDEEYQFWLKVRYTHAAINEKATKEYTKEQMLKWYNSLHTDSSEYKMWGNGIALPNALYMMQGIADVMSEEQAARKKWLYDLLK